MAADGIAYTPDLSSELLAMLAAWKQGRVDPSRLAPRPTRMSQNQQRWLQVKNVEESQETVPPYGVMQLIEAVQETDDLRSYYLTVRSPIRGEDDYNSTGIYLFNGPEAIPYNGFGIGTVDTPTWALYNHDSGTDDPVVGTPMGMTTGGGTEPRWTLSVWQDTGIDRMSEFVSWSEGFEETGSGVTSLGRCLVERDVPSGFGGFVGADAGPYDASSAGSVVEWANRTNAQSGLELDFANDKIVFNYPGIYYISASVSATLDEGEGFELRLRIDDSGTIAENSVKCPVITGAGSGDVALSNGEYSPSVAGMRWIDAGSVAQAFLSLGSASVPLHQAEGHLLAMRMR